MVRWTKWTMACLGVAAALAGDPARAGGGQQPAGSKAVVAADPAVREVECGLVEPDFKAPLRIFAPGYYESKTPACLADRMAFYKVPGVTIAVIDGNRVAWTRGYGRLEAGTDRIVTERSVFEAASATKILTAVVALRLAERGVVDLDRDVNVYLESWKVPAGEWTTGRPVTLRLLLSHRAGINRPDKGLPFDPQRPPTLAQVLAGTPPALNQGAVVERAPASGFQYSNIGYLIVQAVVEEASGKPFAKLARELVFEPLGMESATLDHPLAPAWRDRWGVPHDGDGVARPRTQMPGAVAHGGLVATPTDLARLAIGIGAAFRGESSRLLTKRSAESMLAKAADLDPKEFGGPIAQGLGPMLLGRDETLHFLHPGGNDPGANCWVIASPATGQGAVVMTNAAAGEALMLEILASIAHRYRWPDLSVEKRGGPDRREGSRTHDGAGATTK